MRSCQTFGSSNTVEIVLFGFSNIAHNSAPYQINPFTSKVNWEGSTWFKCPDKGVTTLGTFAVLKLVYLVSDSLYVIRLISLSCCELLLQYWNIWIALIQWIEKILNVWATHVLSLAWNLVLNMVLKPTFA